MGAFEQATGLDPQILRLILLLAYEHLDLTGRRLTATELRAALLKPS